MVTREVPFVGNSTILFSWRNFNAFRKAYGINNLEDFNEFYTKENIAKLTFDDVDKIVGFGLQRKDKEVLPERVSELVAEYLEDHAWMELIDLVINAQLTAIAPNVDEGEVKGAIKKAPKTSKN